MRNFDKSDIKLSFDETNFYCDGNNVTCELVVGFNAPMAFYLNLGSPYIKVKATAKCHPDDVFSYEKGKKIALAKAESRAYRLMKNELLRRWSSLLDNIEALAPLKNAFIDKALSCVEHNDKYIKGITNDDLF